MEFTVAFKNTLETLRSAADALVIYEASHSRKSRRRSSTKSKTPVTSPSNHTAHTDLSKSTSNDSLATSPPSANRRHSWRDVFSRRSSSAISSSGSEEDLSTSSTHGAGSYSTSARKSFSGGSHGSAQATQAENLTAAIALLNGSENVEVFLKNFNELITRYEAILQQYSETVKAERPISKTVIQYAKGKKELEAIRVTEKSVKDADKTDYTSVYAVIGKFTTLSFQFSGVMVENEITQKDVTKATQLQIRLRSMSGTYAVLEKYFEEHGPPTAPATPIRVSSSLEDDDSVGRGSTPSPVRN